MDDDVVGLVLVVGAGYLIYRGIRSFSERKELRECKKREARRDEAEAKLLRCGCCFRYVCVCD